MSGADLADALGPGTAALHRTTTAEQVAETLRRRITDGALPPGTRLREEAVTTALGVSRNTVREAFRLLAHQRLVGHALHRGVHVRTVSAGDVRELFATRRLVQPLGVEAALRDAELRERLRAQVMAARAAASAGDWTAVGTANMAFHLVMVSGCGSVHVTEMFEQLIAELRLAFLQMPDERALHEPYVAANDHLVELLDAGRRTAAITALTGYLDASERQLLAVLDHAPPPRPAPPRPAPP
ncbi:GntR family transcriptional regulator [Pseudonocardia thermophila]|jgi:Transcriptional regulators|uniref:GntR family transcriptional regulator n=1 Tax=Pseudonocardia thermophila TaxID=1848 RepID=UPI00248D92B6|nr:GntR family transcriptional regulator [Pseudonocardia thermophila]